MSTEPRAAVRWAIQWLNADGTLPGLIAGGAAMQTLPRAADTVQKPGLAVGVQATQAPTGAVQTGPRTWTEQTVTLWVKVSQQTFSRVAMEAVEARVLARLDGQYKQVLADGELVECRYDSSLPDIVEPLGDQQVITSTLLFQVSLKVV